MFLSEAKHSFLPAVCYYLVIFIGIYFQWNDISDMESFTVDDLTRVAAEVIIDEFLNVASLLTVLLMVLSC